MEPLLERIRRKPERTRKIILWAGTAAVFAGMLIWQIVRMAQGIRGEG